MADNQPMRTPTPHAAVIADRPTQRRPWPARLARAWRHVWTFERRTQRAFPAQVLDTIEATIQRSEQAHHAEIRFVVETSLPWDALRDDASTRERAQQLFSLLRVWDTEHNNGVLIYVLMADRAVEIVADRGISRYIADAQWQAVCKTMTSAFAQQQFEHGAVACLEQVGAWVGALFPADSAAGATPPQLDNPNELPNRPVLL